MQKDTFLDEFDSEIGNVLQPANSAQYMRPFRRMVTAGRKFSAHMSITEFAQAIRLGLKTEYDFGFFRRTSGQNRDGSAIGSQGDFTECDHHFRYRHRRVASQVTDAPRHAFRL